MQNSSSVRQFHHFQSKIHTCLPTSRTTQELILPGTQIISFQEKNLFIFQWRIVQFETEMRFRNETLRNESEMRLSEMNQKWDSPVRWLSSSMSFSRLVMFPISGGIVPCNSSFSIQDTSFYNTKFILFYIETMLIQ